MTSVEICIERQKLEKDIKASTEALESLRMLCPHVNIFEGNWSWRVGCIDKAEICSDCGKLIKYI